MSAGGPVLETRVRMVAQPASVPVVRRFVGEALTTWGRTELIDDVALSVTELATNATLHTASPYFDVELRAAPDVVRVAVVDGGAVPAQAIADRADRPQAGRQRVDNDPASRLTPADGPVARAAPSREAVDRELDLESMTGRGLFIVSALATRWGIDDLAEGTRVWADFAAQQQTDAVRPTVTSRQATAAPTERRGEGAPQAGPGPGPAGPATVLRLLDCPAVLLLAHDDNLADIARELRLFGASHGDAEAVRRSDAIAMVVQTAALSWNAARLTARQAVEEGRELVDIAFVAIDPDNIERDVGLLRDAVGAAEAMAAQGLLITLPAPEPVQRWRDWVERELVDQVTTGREPRSFLDF